MAQEGLVKKGMIDKVKVIYGLEIQLDDLQKYADNDQPLTLTQEQAQEIISLLKEQESVIEALKSDLDETLKVLGEQPEIVRCEDCKHWDEEYDGHCAINHIFTTHDFYCADGEKAVKRE